METLNWTDPRTGTDWEITLSGGTGVGARAEGDYLPESVPQRITFESEVDKYSFEYPEADKPLSEHSGQELARLLDRAQDEN